MLTEFFRTWTGDPQRDGVSAPNPYIGDFVNKPDVNKFLTLISTKSDNSAYPFSTTEYRELFRHTLWMVLGVKEAKALSMLLREHPVFQHFGIASRVWKLITAIIGLVSFLYTVASIMLDWDAITKLFRIRK